MTRKRFVKLLIAKGVQRNAANEMTKKILNKFGSYKNGLLQLHRMCIQKRYMCADLEHCDDFCCLFKGE